MAKTNVQELPIEILFRPLPSRTDNDKSVAVAPGVRKIKITPTALLGNKKAARYELERLNLEKKSLEQNQESGTITAEKTSQLESVFDKINILKEEQMVVRKSCRPIKLKKIGPVKFKIEQMVNKKNNTLDVRNIDPKNTLEKIEEIKEGTKEINLPTFINTEEFEEVDRIKFKPMNKVNLDIPVEEDNIPTTGIIKETPIIEPEENTSFVQRPSVTYQETTPNTEPSVTKDEDRKNTGNVQIVPERHNPIFEKVELRPNEGRNFDNISSVVENPIDKTTPIENDPELSLKEWGQKIEKEREERKRLEAEAKEKEEEAQRLAEQAATKVALASQAKQAEREEYQRAQEKLRLQYKEEQQQTLQARQNNEKREQEIRETKEIIKQAEEEIKHSRKSLSNLAGLLAEYGASTTNAPEIGTVRYNHPEISQDTGRSFGKAA